MGFFWLTGISSRKNDISAKAILGLIEETKEKEKRLSLLEKSVNEKISKLDKEGDGFREKLKNYNSGLSSVNNFMVGVVLFVSVTFIVTIISLFRDQILADKADKEIYLKYNDVYKIYSDQISSLKDKVTDEKNEINNLKNQLDLLKAKNAYLK